MTSKHWTEDRAKRNQIIHEIGEGKIIKAFRVDRHHPNGAEIHTISDTGIITIYNENTKKMITKLIVRPNQLQRYYKGTCPVGLLNIAKEHQNKGYNKQGKSPIFFIQTY